MGVGYTHKLSHTLACIKIKTRVIVISIVGVAASPLPYNSVYDQVGLGGQGKHHYNCKQHNIYVANSQMLWSLATFF